MKIILITLLFVCLSTCRYVETEPSTIRPDVLVRRYQMECIEETRVNPNVIVSINSGRWKMTWTQQRLAQEWALCVLMKNKVMTKEGVYKIDVAMSRIPMTERDLVEKQIDKCLIAKAIPAGEIALRFIKCFQRKRSIFSSAVSALV